MKAQTTKKRFSSDIHVGLNFATMDIENANMFKTPKIGVNIGVNFNYKILGNIQLQSGLFVTKKGLKQHIKSRTKDETTGTVVANDTITHIVPNYIQVPLALGYEVYLSKNFAFNVNVGGYAAYGFKGYHTRETSSWTVEAGRPPSDVSYGPGIDTDVFDDNNVLRRFDYGVIASVGFIYDIYMINFNYEHGLYNISNDASRVLKTRNKWFSIGFRF
ncbi:MAG: porin family protein [Dysgonomonas sp.]|nr:porin family protein [Dysgonomonas sp.]